MVHAQAGAIIWYESNDFNSTTYPLVLCIFQPLGVGGGGNNNCSKVEKRFQ